MANRNFRGRVVGWGCLFASVVMLTICTHGLAEDEAKKAKASAASKTSEKPIRALLVTGGCCHDYDRQKLILTKGVSARANVVWTVVHQGGKSTNARISLYEDPNWADGFDVVVHNECFANVRDEAWVERILRPHREGIPAVLIHCAMHCYRTGNDKWFDFVGVQSPGHGAHYSFTVENLKSDHPIMAGFGKQWVAPKGELYHTVKLFPHATPLAQARRRNDGKPQTCIWTNEYGNGRVFATTLSHYNEVMADPKYLDMVTRGLLWSADRLNESEIKTPTAETSDMIRSLATIKIDGQAAPLAASRCCGDGNLALGKPTKAKSEESNKKNYARHAVDGELGTRWCAAGGQNNQWWQVDLEKPQHVKSLRIHWEKPGAAYKYKVEASADEEKWRTIVDKSKNKKAARIAPHKVDSPDTRFLRVTFLGSKPAFWGSLWEFEAYDRALPELPKGIDSPQGGTSSVGDVQAPDDFEVTMFAAPPQVNYPVCLTAAATGEVFVGVDEQGSLGKKPGGGKVLRCIDLDGDGKADQVNEFAKMDHPRGLVYDDGSLWVLHPPLLSVFHDDDRDGVADRQETLVTGISTDEVNRRGADHTTNGIRMGIDGWIYIAVGDFGMIEAKGTDGKTRNRRGGGIVRVRPDGTELEIHAWGLRNVLDACIDPYMNIFTRDNTNDGGGWDIRLSHIIQSGEYGYPSLYMNFADEIMPPLAQYGGGSGCGGMFLHDLRWPEPYANAVYTCDWGTSTVYRHTLPPEGATFKAQQETFLKIPRPTDIDVDGQGLMYVSSWKNGKFDFSGVNVGFVAQLRPKNFLPKPFPNIKTASSTELVDYLASPSAVYRLHCQRELIRRSQAAGSGSPGQGISGSVRALASDETQPVYARVAAIFTLKQIDGAASHDFLAELTKDAAVREFAMRALTDRKSQLKNVSSELFVANLDGEDPRSTAQALISLGRLADSRSAAAILPWTRRAPASDSEPPSKKAPHAQPDAERVIPHLAVRALVEMNAVEACLKALNGEMAEGALWALKYMHADTAVDGLVRQLGATREISRRQAILTTLIRLYHQEGQYKGGWWGTRPDTSGPYYDRQAWSQSPRIAAVVRTAVADSDSQTAELLRKELTRHKVKIEGVSSAEVAAKAEPETVIVLPKVDSNDKSLIANMPIDLAITGANQTAGKAEQGKQLFTTQSCVACHTYADGQTPKGPHLVDIGKRYKRAELVESLLKPSAKIAQGFDTYSFAMEDGRVLTGFVVSESADSVRIRHANGLSAELARDEIEARKKQETSMMPQGLVNNLTPKQLADLLAYLESLKSQ